MKPLHTLLWLILLFVITFTLIVPPVCISLPFSKFYYLYNKQDDVTKKAELLNSERYKKSLAYFSSLHSESSKLFYLNMKKSGHLDLVVAIITVKRNDGTLGYLTQSVAKMDKLLKEDRNFERKFMFICNVDQNLYGHEEARNLEKFIPVEYRFENLSGIHQSSPHKVLYHLHKNFDTYQKETIDYMFCLEMAYSMNPDYVLLVEDDTLPLPMALDVLTTKLRWLTLFRSEPMKNYAFIKLYYPPKWQGFGNEMRRILEVIAIGMVGGGCFFIFAIRKKIFTQYLYFVLGAIYFIIFALLLDRQNVLELRRLASQLYSLNISPGCCTPAMFYPKWIIPSLLNYLANDNNKHHTDIAIYNFITSNNLTAYQIEPNLFAHIGMYTSVHQNSRKDPQEFIFSM
ncbi:post-GPI attachment to proteins factor 4-like [Saccostrea cucullata]|uniref:post-GPI attachment to proteins factor 4-like n=1 Tax=Saccostrea cuccullata TaxID=36930 RepID=UPI002ED47A06